MGCYTGTSQEIGGSTVIDLDAPVWREAVRAKLGLVAADVPRDGHGRWCKGVGCQEGTGTIVLTNDPLVFGKLSPEARLTGPTDWFASDDEFAAAQALAAEKARNVPRPSLAQVRKNRKIAARAASGEGRAGGDLRGSSYVRRDRAEALFDQFGGRKRGYVPCTYCGIKVSPKGRGGFAHMEQDKILVLTEGGTYGTARNFPNLIPSCAGCNKHRGATPYPVRPAWEGSRRPRGLTAAAGAHSPMRGMVVVAFPENWDDPLSEGPGRPVKGVLDVRMVEAFFGSYEQWIVGGEVVDPTTVSLPDVS